MSGFLPQAQITLQTIMDMKILPAFENGWAVWCHGGPACAVLVIFGLFDGEQFLVREKEYETNKSVGKKTNKSVESLQSYALAIAD